MQSAVVYYKMPVLTILQVTLVCLLLDIEKWAGEAGGICIGFSTHTLWFVTLHICTAHVQDTWHYSRKSWMISWRKTYINTYAIPNSHCENIWGWGTSKIRVLDSVCCSSMRWMIAFIRWPSFHCSDTSNTFLFKPWMSMLPMAPTRVCTRVDAFLILGFLRLANNIRADLVPFKVWVSLLTMITDDRKQVSLFN